MAFDKFYPNRKDWRSPWHHRKVGCDDPLWEPKSRGCRNHGDCAYCANNRAFRGKRQAPLIDTGYCLDGNTVPSDKSALLKHLVNTAREECQVRDALLLDEEVYKYDWDYWDY